MAAAPEGGRRRGTVSGRIVRRTLTARMACFHSRWPRRSFFPLAMPYLPHRPRSHLNLRPRRHPLRYYVGRVGWMLLQLLVESLQNLSLYLAGTLGTALLDPWPLVIDPVSYTHLRAH